MTNPDDAKKHRLMIALSAADLGRLAVIARAIDASPFGSMSETIRHCVRLTVAAIEAEADAKEATNV